MRNCIATTKNFTKAIPLIEETRNNCLPLEKELLENPNKFYVTQGFIGKTLEGETTTLEEEEVIIALVFWESPQRPRIQIWTDVAGCHN